MSVYKNIRYTRIALKRAQTALEKLTNSPTSTKKIWENEGEAVVNLTNVPPHEDWSELLGKFFTDKELEILGDTPFWAIPVGSPHSFHQDYLSEESAEDVDTRTVDFQQWVTEEKQWAASALS